MPSIPHSFAAGLLAYAGPLLAAALALAGALLCRNKGRRQWLPVVGAIASLAGWALLAPVAGLARALPRSGIGMLVLPGAVAAILLLVAGWRRGRWERWSAVAAAGFAGWWLAGSPAGAPQFWRVWAASGALAWVLARIIAGQPSRGLACALALWGGAVITGVQPGWTTAAAVGATVWAGLLAAGPGATVPAGLTAALLVATDISTGRLVRGGLAPADLVCIAAGAAPFAAALLAPRLRRAGAAGPLLAGVLGATVAAALAWTAQRALRM